MLIPSACPGSKQLVNLSLEAYCSSYKKSQKGYITENNGINVSVKYWTISPKNHGGHKCSNSSQATH
uniref:Uncharacterized protein n=1 Tax=Arundo donax TaxID=35708 RepID=A0A0A9DW48_ARUDO